MLVNYVFLFYSVKISSLMGYNYKNKFISYTPIIVEQFFTNFSLLSRLMPVTTLLFYLRFSKIMYKNKRYIFHTSYLIFIVIISLLSVVLTNTIRHADTESVEEMLSYAERDLNTESIYNLDFILGHSNRDWMVKRFIGIDGVYNITEYQKNHEDVGLFKRLSSEKRIPGELSIYNRDILNLKVLYEGKNSIHIPGFVGYLSSGFNQYWIYLILIIVISSIKLIEMFVTYIAYGDKLCGSVIAYFVTYRLVHSGVYIADNYKLFVGLIAIIISYLLLNYFLLLSSKYFKN